ncbi:hypothetical protein MUP59_02640 [Candidatus Bathyarchaeota archaeon]|nr:hypothetical protein [Candidatus Bathyarchaeota archaeon]
MYQFSEPSDRFQRKDTVELLIALLRCTLTCKKLSIEALAHAARYPSCAVKNSIERFASLGLLTYEGATINIDHRDRLRLALEAIRRGVDSERVCRALGFREFEDVGSEALRLNGYKTSTRFNFKHSGRRYEIDLVAAKDCRILCIDFKHWAHGLSKSQLSSAVKKQVERTEALKAEKQSYGREIGIRRDQKMAFVPAIVTLTDCETRLVEKVPIFPIPNSALFFVSLIFFSTDYAS